MNYATGYAFNAKEVVSNFDYKSIKVTGKECEALIGNRHKEYLVEQLLKYCIKLVLDDIIYNNCTFRLPTGRECCLYLKQFCDEDFIKQRRQGKWRGVDFYTTNYTAYQLTFRYFVGQITLEKPVYCNPKYRDAIVSHINKGGAYHDGNIKTINDYYDRLYTFYPSISHKDVQTMIKFAWRCIYLLNYRRADICINSYKNNFWFLMGNLRSNPIKHYNYYRKKLGIKLRIMYHRSKQQWDGYYYFGLTRTEYQEYIDSIKSVGRKRKWFTFKKKLLFKIKDEANIKSHSCVCIMRIKVPILLGFAYYKPILKCESPEVVLVRETLKFKDILITSNNYDYI